MNIFEVFASIGLKDDGFNAGLDRAKNTMSKISETTGKVINDIVGGFNRAGNSVETLATDVVVYTEKQQEKIDALTRTFTKQNAAVERQKQVVGELKAQYDTLLQKKIDTSPLAALERKLEGVNKTLAITATDLTRLLKARDDWKFVGNIEAHNEIRGLSTFFKSLRNRQRELQEAIANTKFDPTATEGAKKLAATIELGSKKLTDMAEAAAETDAKLKKAMQPQTVERFNGTVDRAKSTFTGTASGATKMGTSIKRGFNTVIKGIGTAVSAGAGGLKKITSGVLSLGKHSRSTGNSITHLGIRIKNLLAAALVFNVLRRGFSEMRKYFGDLLQTDAEFVQSLTNIKANLMTAFQPIFEYIMPALNVFMQGISKATGYVANFTAMLSGKTYEQAKAAAKAINQQAQALKNTGKAAKDAVKNLQGFDQLNRLMTKNTDGSADIGTLFDNAAVPEVDTSWLDRFIGKLREYTPDLEYFYGLGNSLGSRMIKGLQSIPWSEIEGWGVSYIKKFATFMNGLVDSGIIQQAGSTLAKGFNTFLKWLYTGLTDFNWANLGKALAQGLNNVLHDTDWELLGKTLSEFFKGVLAFISTAIREMDWIALGNSIKDFLVGIDWGGISDELFRVLGNAFGGLTLFLYGLFSDAFTTASKMLQEETDKAGGNIILGLLNGIDRAISGVSAWIYDHVVNPFVTGIKEMFGIKNGVSSTATEDIGKAIIEGLFYGIFVAINPAALTVMFYAKVVKPIIEIFKLLFGIRSPSKVFAEMGGYLIQGLWDGMTALGSWIVEKVTGLFSGIVDKAKGILSGTDFAGIGKNIVKGFWDGIESSKNWLNDKVGGFFGGVADKVKSVLDIHSPSRIFAGIGQMVGAGFVDGVEHMTGAVNSAIDRVFGSLERDVSANLLPTVTPTRGIAAPASAAPTYGADMGRVEYLLEMLIDAVRKGSVIEIDGQTLGRTTSRNQNSLSQQFGQNIVTA